MKKSDAGFGMIEVLFVIGLLATIGMVSVSVMSHLFRSISSAQKGANRLEILRGISTALSDRNTCKLAMGAGTLAIPNNWSTAAGQAIPISRIQVGNKVLAQVNETIDDIRMTQMRLEMISGPYPIQYNVAAAGAAPDLRNYRRYFSRLVVSPVKAGGATGNVGGESFKDSEFKIAVLVSNADRLVDCFGGIEESDLNSICERGFEGQYDENRFPWCTPLHMSIGIPKSSLPAQYPRFAVLEKQNETNPQWDLTMALYGNGLANSNGPALWFVDRPATPISPTGNVAVIGYANRVDAYTPGSKTGDFIISNKSATGDLEIGSRDVRLKMRQSSRDILVNQGINIRSTANFNEAHGLSIYSTASQGRIVVGGVSDGGETYSALYLSGTNASTPINAGASSWVIAHKGPATSIDGSFQIGRWQNQASSVAITITPNLNFGVGTTNPSEKMEVAGGAVIQGNMRVNSNVFVTGVVASASDERLKKNVTPLKDSLSRVLQLSPVSFVWKSDPTSQKQIGFIAQEVEKIVPEVVSSEGGTLRVAYGTLVALVAGAIQELQHFVQKLNQDAEETRLRVDRLEEKIQAVISRQEEMAARNKALKEQINQCIQQENRD